MNSLNTILLCRSLRVPTPEQIVDALCQAGYDAFVEAESGSLIAILEVELKYASDRMPIKIEFNHEEHKTQYDIGYEEWRWRKDIVPETMDQKDIRRYIFVYAPQDVDAGALQAVIDYVAHQAEAVVASQQRLN